MRTLWKRLLSGFLSLVLLMTLVPTAAFAANDSGSGTAEPVNPFTDVKKGDWFYDAVLYAYANGFFSGTTATTYEPQGTMTRGMFVTVLGRMAGVDPADYSGGTDFSDVNVNKYYAPYIEWAVKYGIVTGYADGTFRPDAKVTRQQMAAFFVRYFEAFGVDYETGASITTTPADLASVSAYAQDAVLKLWKQGLLNGDGVNFNPGGNASRAQAATLCMRADKAVETWYSEPGVPSERVSVDPAEQQPEQTEEEKKPNSTSSSSGSSSRGQNTITLNMPDGSTDTIKQTTSKLDLSILTTPKQDGYYFLGWYYDKACTLPAQDGDTLTSNNTALYAKTLKSGEIETSETPYFTVSTNVDTGFTITVNSKSDEDLTKKITVSGPEQFDQDGNSIGILTVTRSGNTYTISGPGSDKKLLPGGSYQVTLEDNALTFAAVEEASIREYHFTVQQSAQVMNLHLKDDVKQIHISKIGGSAQLAAQNLSPMTVLAGENGSATANTSAANSGTTGSFTYTDSEGLKVGDTVAIYEGTAPKERYEDPENPADDISEVSYVTITEVDGNKYTYTAAAVEDVLFMPDVLPIQSGWDQDTTDGNVLTITASNLTATMNDVKAESLDKGDFLAFYTGTSVSDENAKITGYGCVTDVKESGGNYVITYETAEEEDVNASMDFSTKNTVDGDELLEGVDRNEIAESIEEQAVESGFAQVVAQNLAAAVSTMDLSELEDGELDLSSIDLSGLAAQDLSFGTLQSAAVSTYAGGNARGGSGSGPEVEIENVRAQVGTNLAHFNGSGVRISLELEVSIAFDAGEDEENITITLTPTFVQELKLDINSNGGVVWKKWFIFKYIYDFYANVSVDMYTYTSINLNATISSTGGDESEIKEMVESVSGVIKDLRAKFKGENIEVTEGISDLQDLYSEMLENDTEWITLYRKNINEQKWNVATFINITLAIDFVVQANVNISLGLEFDYTNAKRYNYTVYIFHGKSTNNTINLLPESYTLQLYAMGVLGIRAGVEVSLSVALIHKSVAAVGVVVNVGAYLKVYGYVIYKLEHVAGQPDKTSGSGAVYIEVGCYLDIGMDLTAFGGALSWQPTLYANEWPLWTAGNVLAVSGFAATQEDEDGNKAEPPTVYMRKAQTTIDVPSELRTMTGFDMRTGADAEKTYDVSLFNISFSDDRFKLENGKITLDFGDGVTWATCGIRELECDMTITWMGAPLSFSTETFQIKTRVHWDQYDEYSYAFFDVQGADRKIPTKQLESAGTLTIPEMTDADHPGYIWEGWTVERINPDGTTEPLTVAGNTVEMKGYDLQLTANWEARTDIHYWIQPMFQKLDGTYEEGESAYVKGEAYEVTDGQVDIEFAPTLTPYDGYVTPDIGNRHRIKADGTSVIIAHYPRQQYSFVRYLYEDGSFMSGSYLYGDTIDWTPPTRDGYTFTSWTVKKVEWDESGTPTYTVLDTSPVTMPTYALEVTANWTVNDNTPFTANIYLENENGGYDFKESKTYIGTTDTVAKPDVASDYTQAASQFTLPSYDGYTLRGNCKNITITITGDGRASANYYYDQNRTTLTVKHVFSNGKTAVDETLNCVGTNVPDSTQTFTGYTREAKWYLDADCKNETSYPTTLTADTILYAKWTPDSVSYTVEHYQQNLDGTYPETPTETETLTGSVDQTFKPDRKTYDGFTAPEGTQVTLTVDATKNVIQYQYPRNSYTLTLDYGDGRANSETDVLYEASLSPETPERTGWNFVGWCTDADCNTANSYTTMPAKALTLYAKWAPQDGITYTVEHWQQNAAGEGYTRVDADRETLSGTAGTDTAATAKTYEGFTLKDDTVTQKTIQGDGTTVVQVYYDRIEYTLTYKLNAERASFNDNVASTVTDRYGATLSLLTAQNVTYAGYSFDGWFTDAACTTEFTETTMPMKDTDLYAKWTAGGVDYTVNVYLQNVNDANYTKSETDSYTSTGTVDTTIAGPVNIEGFTAPTPSSATLSATEKNEVDYYYTRNQYQLSYSGLDNVTWETDYTAPTGGDVYYGADLTLPDMTKATRTGYTFKGWYTDANCTTENSNTTMPAYDLTLYAKWEPITYTLRFNPDGNLPLKTWLLAQTGAELVDDPVNNAGDYANYGMPYIDFTVAYDAEFKLPEEGSEVVTNSGMTGFRFGVFSGSYDTRYYIDYYADEVSGLTATFGGTLKNLTSEQDAIIVVEAKWPYLSFDYDSYSTQDNPAKIYSVSQLWDVLAGSTNSYYPYSKLMVDLEACNQTASGSLSNGGGSSWTDGWFDGNGHTIKALKTQKAANNMNGNVGVLDQKRVANFTVKNVTLDGFTVTCTASTGGYNYHDYYGGLFGSVGDNFTLEDVTVKNLTMDLTLNGELAEYQQLSRDCIGGLIGYAEGSVTLKNVTVTGTTLKVTLPEGSNAAVGSLIGYAAGAVTIENCNITDVDGYQQIGFDAASGTGMENGSDDTGTGSDTDTDETGTGDTGTDTGTGDTGTDTGTGDTDTDTGTGDTDTGSDPNTENSNTTGSAAASYTAPSQQPAQTDPAVLPSATTEEESEDKAAA